MHMHMYMYVFMFVYVGIRVCVNKTKVDLSTTAIVGKVCRWFTYMPPVHMYTYVCVDIFYS